LLLRHGEREVRRRGDKWEGQCVVEQVIRRREVVGEGSRD
jgi:hypothetical protein